MYSKYISDSNWASLSSNYRFDNNLSMSNVYIPVDANLNLTFTPFLSNLKDYSNNNYSLFFLTGKKSINDLIIKDIPVASLNNSVCLIAYNLENNLVSETTKFLNINPPDFNFNSITELSNRNFFEIEFLDASFLVLKQTSKNINYYLAIDDITTNISFLSSSIYDTLTDFEIDKLKLGYILDDSKIILYKNLQGLTYFVSKSLVADKAVLSLGDFNNITKEQLLYYTRVGDLPSSSFTNTIVKYKTEIGRNNLSINTDKSYYNLKNNYLLHAEYNNLQATDLGVNILTLKNQVDISDEINNNTENNTFREYTSLFTGGEREEGHSNISLNYKSKYNPVIFKADKVTWFHLPYNKSNSKIAINDSNFVINGAIAGSAPIYSDKIWKKIGDYAYSSNLGESTGNEQTGRWLCSWLSGGNNSQFLWVDRFYNTNTYTPYEALTYSTNVTYVPEFQNRTETGITDIPSSLTLEQGVWYAYSHLGQQTAKSILSGIKFIDKQKLSSFKNNNGLDLATNYDEDGNSIYEFNGDCYGTLNVPSSSNFNNFSLSFFATRANWNVSDVNCLIGNYLDSGFGIYNNNKFNPILYYINDKKIHFYNNEYKNLLTLDVNFYLSGEDFKVVDIFRKDVTGNFHVLTSNYKILEFTANGTLVDKTEFSNLVTYSHSGSAHITSSTNNSNFGVIKLDNGQLFTIDLATNLFTVPASSSFIYIDYVGATKKNESIIINNYNIVHIIGGMSPIIKSSNIYYKSEDSNSIKVYSINDSTINTYLSSTSGNIVSYNFDNQDNTYLLYDDRLEFYNQLGEYVSTKNLRSIKSDLSACNIAFQDLLNNNNQITVQFIDSKNKNYFLNVDKESLSIIDTIFNSRYNTLSGNLAFKNFDMSNYTYVQSVINNSYPLPSYNFKLKIYNQLNFEDSHILNMIILGEVLDTGIHHICVTFDTLKGLYSLYIDGILYGQKTFKPKIYSYSSILKDNFAVGTTPYYNGTTFKDFYGSNSVNFNANDLKIEKLKLYNDVLIPEEVKLLYYEMFPPHDISVNFEIGERNYIDTVARTFRHKLQGSKSNLINLYINNSLITDSSMQSMYETMIIKDLQQHLPAYVKINKIVWLNTSSNYDPVSYAMVVPENN